MTTDIARYVNMVYPEINITSAIPISEKIVIYLFRRSGRVPFGRIPAEQQEGKQEEERKRAKAQTYLYLFCV